MVLRCALIFFLSLVSLQGETKAIIFDFGGVMTGSFDKNPMVVFLKKTLDLQPEEWEHIRKERYQEMEFQGDLLFWQGYAKEKNIILTPNWSQQFLQVALESIQVSTAMYDLVEALKKASYQVGLLSNIEKRYADIVAACHLYDPFSPCLLSCDLSLEKPDPAIYLKLLEVLEHTPEEIVFIDDKLENIEAAQHLGIDAVHFCSFETLIEDLRARGIVFQLPTIAS